jgi:hypothetical protein
MLRVGAWVVILVAACYFLVALRREGEMRKKARVQFFLGGLFLVAVGGAAVTLNQGSLVSALTFSTYSIGTGAICLGYSVWIALILEMVGVAWEKGRRAD